MASSSIRALTALVSMSRNVSRFAPLRQMTTGHCVLGAKNVGRLNALKTPVVCASVRWNHFQGNNRTANLTKLKIIVQIHGKYSSCSSSPVRQNFHADCEKAINEQIALELSASYTYRSMAWYFDRHDVALKGFHNLFKKMTIEESEHADLFLGYLNKRGGTILLSDIRAPDSTEWGDGLEAIEAALEMEKTLNRSLLALHQLANKHGDPHLSNFLEDEFLREQVDSIKFFADYATSLRRAGKGLGEFMFDHETLLEDTQSEKEHHAKENE